MRASSSLNPGRRLETAVRALCPIIERNVSINAKRSWTEYEMRRELVGCVLGSQVRYEMATLFLERLDQAGLLADELWISAADSFESRVFDVLSGRSLKANRHWCYRFPKSRAHQLSRVRDALAEHSLSERLSESCNPKQLRLRLVSEITGLGPKQASMFLRNVGRSYELAILDVHVLRYMTIQGSLDLQRLNIATVSSYERAEMIVINYANSLGYPVGYIDWAVWAVMRAAKELGL